MSADVELRVVDDPAAAAAELLAEAALSGGRIALCGGSTPRPAYELAARLQSDWSRAEVWFGDERCVPPDDPRSNYRLVRETLLDLLEQPPSEVRRIRGELEPGLAAEEYDGLLRGIALDLILLGIGPDGHTASLFPDSPALGERDRLAVAVDGALDPYVRRVTLTTPALEATPLLVFLSAGAGKAEPVARAFGGSPDPSTPASMIRSAAGRTVAILDPDAASLLG